MERRNGASKQCEYTGHLFPKPLETLEVCCTGAAHVYSKICDKKNIVNAGAVEGRREWINEKTVHSPSLTDFKLLRLKVIRECRGG